MAEEAPKAWQIGQGGRPELNGMRCGACGALAFPAQTYGCIRCGAHGERLESQAIATNGALLTYAVVRSHPSHAVPFTLAEVQLDAGPIVRVQLAETTPHTPGTRVTAIAVEDDAGPHLEFVEEGSR